MKRGLVVNLGLSTVGCDACLGDGKKDGEGYEEQLNGGYESSVCCTRRIRAVCEIECVDRCFGCVST